MDYFCNRNLEQITIVTLYKITHMQYKNKQNTTRNREKPKQPRSTPCYNQLHISHVNY